MATEQQFCLKWNNHRSTLFSVFDTLLEEESLVDVTLSAEGQFLRAHRVILSACSPYFRNMFKSQFLNDKHPVVIMKDVEFENLKSLVEYMYKGEANVPQNMLSAFIKDAESLQIRGLAECASKQFEAEQLSSRPHSTPISKKSKQTSPLGPGGILAARLAKMGGAGGNGGDPVAPGMSMFDFPPEAFPSMLARSPALMAMQQAAAASHHGLGQPPMMKKSRKSAEPRPRLGSPHKEAKKLKLKAVSQGTLHTNNNDGDDEEGGLKIDEDADAGKENIAETSSAAAASKMEEADLADMDHSTGVSDEEEEPSMPGPGGELAEAASEIINPWDGRKLQLSEEQDENSAQDDTGLVGWSNMLGDFSETPTAQNPSLSSSMATPTSASDPASNRSNNTVPRLKRLNNAQQHNVYTLCQTAEGTVKFRCTECSRCFNLKCTLLRHVRHQHQGRFVPHPCGQCGQVFKRTDHLKVHMRKIHKMASASRANRGQGQNLTAAEAVVAAAVATMATTLPQPQPLALIKTKSEEEAD